ncbi:catalase-2 [Dulcicalothrix desertica PCC 7102]|uniref:Catalase n=1 Tax=Dulcicalothrix desertica PCC 7102 TaxID=232991 RepID=A0A3S1ANE2_9CYAN|nr:catalase [Dulcicalothrix desertica]RUT05465.1 catalase-2 [Dulcicalothrix desertica PCC 7102]TWH54565.1 catalase [Dulcicalothrix desertica PCC 7102]
MSEHTNEQSKNQDLEQFRKEPGELLTTNEGVKVNNTNDSLKTGTRGPSLLEDFHLLEKNAHFNRERIPERVVHARGVGAHGYFQPYESLKELTKAKFLQDPSVKTPVFVRFSTVAGFRGSADAVRDVRGFAVKFYTEDGNYDLVGNNIPVFFIQDAMKFPDLIHAVKPEPHNEMPQASTAHDNFWDFVSLMPESMHMIMWVLSDRTIPRSYRMMQGFGIHTFRFVNEQGKARFVKFHWKPLLGIHSMVFDEIQTLGGKDPDFHRRDLLEAIEMGDYPEYELGVQIVEEEDEFKFDFDILDSTKIIPEELVPIKPIGKMVLNRVPDNFFAETEQVAFQPTNVVPGIDFSDDPLLQGRIFAYPDTQRHRLGTANFESLPINRPVCPVHNDQRDGFSQYNIYTSKVNYSPNSLGGGCPMASPENMGAFVHYAEKLGGRKVRERSESFSDHFSQATLFLNSMSKAEKEHLVKAAHFELGKVMNKEVKERVVGLFNHIDHEFATLVAAGLGLEAPAKELIPNHGKSSPALSMENQPKDSIKTRQIAVLAADGVDAAQLMVIKKALEAEGALTRIVSKFGGKIKGTDGKEIDVERTFLTSASVMFDAIYIPGGEKSIATLKMDNDVSEFIYSAFKHCKAIAATGEGVDLIAAANIKDIKLADAEKSVSDKGVITSRNASDVKQIVQDFVKAIAQHRHWIREEKKETKQMIPA